MTAAERPGAPMTIGEVLATLLPDFPDVTVSKIRFLDGAGLVAPQRSGSGYRRFSDSDVDRLRQVLTLQRDRYLPLKVIKGHIEAGTLGDTLAEPPAGPVPATPPHATARAHPVPTSAVLPITVPPSTVTSTAASSTPGSSTAGSAPGPAAGAVRTRTARGSEPRARHDGAVRPRPDALSRPVAVPAAEVPLRADPAARGEAAVTRRLPTRAPASRRLRLDELSRTSGLTPDGVAELESAGLIRPHGGWYQPEDVVTATVAAQLAAYGVGPRHLRGLRSAADRELGLLEQSLVPVLSRGRPDARARAEETARVLRELYAQLHAALVVSGLRDLGIEPR